MERHRPGVQRKNDSKHTWAAGFFFIPDARDRMGYLWLLFVTIRGTREVIINLTSRGFGEGGAGREIKRNGNYWEIKKLELILRLQGFFLPFSQGIDQPLHMKFRCFA